MKKILFILLLIVSAPVCSQVVEIHAGQICVNWNKTTHIIFSTEIKYFSIVDEYVQAQQDKNVLSLTANEKGFKGITSLAVATADGNFYNYEVYYTDTLENSTYTTIGKAIPVNRIGVNTKADVHLLFPAQVNFIEYGSDAIEVVPAGNLQNLIKIKTPKAFDFQTNILVRTTTNEFFCFNIDFDDSEKRFSYSVDGKKEVLLDKTELTDEGRADIENQMENKGRKIFNLGIKENKVDFSIHNIFIRDNKLVFRLNLRNNSNINYDIDYAKFYITDKKNTKKTASQEIEVIPLFINEYEPLIPGQENLSLIICFEKFTIPNDKLFIIDINEKEGGRHIRYKIKNEDIINAERL